MAKKDLVTVSEGTIQLPTYAIKGENPNPVFRSQYGVAHIYPYTLLDDIAAQPVERTYRTLVLENRYLRVTVIPDLGGRIYSVYDKLSECEVFYKNSVVKFSPLAIRGAFFSGGVEFSFPVAHAPTTADRVNWDIRQNPDGSASISFGGLEHISRLRWMITLTLYPDRCALAQDVYLYNPYSIPGRYHYWTNASVEADDSLEFIYPLRRVRSYEFAGTASWPIARLDLVLNDPGLPGMEGVPMWPADRMRQPVNFRWQKNMLAQVSIFGRDVAWDFFGAWRHSVNHGYAHFAEHRNVAGMKLWSWGNAGVGVVNQTALTDDGSLYAETQCGAMETQLDFSFLQPGETRSWREWWLPMRQIGGLSCASAEAGARLHLSPSGNDSELECTLAVCPARALGKARLELSAEGVVLLSETAAMSPEKPWLAKRRLSAVELKDKPIRLVVFDEGGQTVLDYTFDRQPSPPLPDEPRQGGTPTTAEEYYQAGLRYENFDNREQALAAYRRAIQLNPRHAQAHFRLGLMLLRAADFAAAESAFRRARLYGLPDANYYLGLLALLQERLPTASRFFAALPADSSHYPASQVGLGVLALRKRQYQAACEQFQQALQKNSGYITAAVLLGVALSRLGQGEKARRELHAVLDQDPLNHAALHELSRLGEQECKSKLERLLADDRQYWLDLACFYIGAGLLPEALELLRAASQTWSYPMISYLAAWIELKLGRAGNAQAWLETAATCSPDYCFPSRLEEVVALRAALERNPKDFKARYYLGNFLYARQRFAEAIQLWQEALPGLQDYDVIHRNLGLAAWQREQDLPKAIAYFEKALVLNPRNQDVYIHLDDLYKSQGLTEKRRELLQKITALEELREDVRKRRILMLVDLGEYEEALQIMQTQTFVPLEMDQSFHDLFVRALMQRAEARLARGQAEEAIADYKLALTYPPNLGVGEPTTLNQAHIYYHMGLAYEQMGRFAEALAAWRSAASEHHPHGHPLFEFVQMALDKLGRYSELGMDAI